MFFFDKPVIFNVLSSFGAKNAGGADLLILLGRDSSR